MTPCRGTRVHGVRRVTELGTQGAAWSKSASLTKTAVQQEQLAASLAQVSTAAARKDHERAQQVAGLAARLEVLEKEGTKREQIVTQVSCRAALRQPSWVFSADKAPIVPHASKALSGDLPVVIYPLGLNMSLCLSPAGRPAAHTVRAAGRHCSLPAHNRAAADAAAQGKGRRGRDQQGHQ